MTRISWDSTSEKYYETGIDRCVFYPQNGVGTPWNGVSGIDSIKENRTPVPTYIDGIKINETAPPGDFAAVISAYTYPDILSEYEGLVESGNGLMVDNQFRKRFDMIYRTRIGNDIDGVDHGYKIHFVYNALATIKDVTNDTVNDKEELTPFSWDISTIPVLVDGFRPTSHFVIVSTKTDPYVLAELENLLYGSETREARMPQPNELIDTLYSWADLLVYDHGDGLFTARSTKEAVQVQPNGEFTIDSPQATYITTDLYNLTSL